MGQDPNPTSTKDLVTILRTCEAANEEVGGRRDIIDTIWCIKAELAQRPVTERLDAGYGVSQ